MSSVNSIASEKLARLIGTPKSPALVDVYGQTTTFRLTLGLSPALFAACPTRQATGRPSFEDDQPSSFARRA